MSVFDTCVSQSAGINVIKCFVAEASYFPSIAILIVLFAIIFFRLELEPTKSRFATSLFAVTIIAMVMVLGGLLPPQTWSILAILTVFSTAMMFWK